MTAPTAARLPALDRAVEWARREYQYAAIADRQHPTWAREPAATCPVCAFASLRAEAAGLVSDLAVASAHPAPDWRAFQDLIWEGRLEATLRREVAWA